MPDKPHVCLIVDNPLRDLEGLVLLGRQLAAKGATVTLVPMYEQGFRRAGAASGYGAGELYTA